MTNKTTIDLVADPKGIRVGTAEGTKNIKEFAQGSIKNIEELGESTKELESQLDKIKNKLADVVSASSGVTEENVKLAASLAATSAELAAAFGLLGPIAAGLVAVKTAAEVAKFAFDGANESVEVLDKSLLESQKIIDAYGGDIEGLKKRLEELGVTDEDVGLKIEDSWDRV